MAAHMTTTQCCQSLIFNSGLFKKVARMTLTQAMAVGLTTTRWARDAKAQHGTKGVETCKTLSVRQQCKRFELCRQPACTSDKLDVG